MHRIEVYEKYIVSQEKNEEYWESLGIKPPASEYGYRRTLILLDQIERPIEIPGNKNECVLRFWGGDDIVIKCSYDDFCIQLNDIEERMMIEQSLIQYEIENANQGG